MEYQENNLVNVNIRHSLVTGKILGVGMTFYSFFLGEACII